MNKLIEEFINEYNVAYIDREQQMEVSAGMRRDIQKIIDSSKPKRASDSPPLTNAEYNQAREVALRMFETCENDIGLTFHVLKKIISWSRVESIQLKYISAALVLTELFLTEFKND